MERRGTFDELEKQFHENGIAVQVDCWYCNKLSYKGRLKRKYYAENILSSKIEILNPDCYIVASPFGGSDRDAFVPRYLSRRIPVFSICYDFIPFENEEGYLNTKFLKTFYNDRLSFLQENDAVFCISEYTQQIARKYIPFANSLVLGTGLDRFWLSGDNEPDAEILKKYNINGDYILYFIFFLGGGMKEKTLSFSYKHLTKSVRRSNVNCSLVVVSR